MPRLQILRHKSYHPYNEVNKQRVREDEAKAAAAAEAEEQRALAADSEARLDILRRRANAAGPSIAGSSSLLDTHRAALAKEKKKQDKQKLELHWPIKPSGDDKGKGKEVDAVALDGSKHINFWAGIEAESKPAPNPVKKDKSRSDAKEDDSHALYRETKPWYADAQLRKAEERLEGEEAEAKRERRRRKEERHKTSQDPMTAVRTALASSATPEQKAGPFARRSLPTTSHADPLIAARLQREAAERARAMKLVQDAKRAQGLETPRSSVAGSEYGDMWNEDDVRAARRRKEEARHGGRRASWEPRRSRTSGSWEV